MSGVQTRFGAPAASSLPTASGAGQLPVSDGAGDDYTATARSAVVGGGLVTILTGSPAGTTIIADGAGDLSVTSADVSAMLAAANAATAAAAIGAAGVTRFAPALATGQGWTADGTIAGMTWSYEAGDIARLTYAAGPLTHDLDGPQIERALTFNPGARYRVRVTPRAQTSSAGVRTMGGLYIRNATSTVWRVLWWSGIERLLYTGPWTGNDGGGLDGILSRGADGFALDGTDSMELRWTPEGAFSYVAIGSTGLSRVLHTGTLGFIPAAFGLVGATDDAITAGTQDFSGLSCEAWG